MIKRIFLFFYLGVIGFLLSSNAPSAPAMRPLVSSMDVYCRLDGEVTHMHLSDALQIQPILCCLRAVDSHIPAPEQPPSATGDSYLIQVQLTNGKCHLYRQLSTEYFARDSELWKQIDSRQGNRIFTLLRTLKAKGFQGAFLFFGQYAISIPKYKNLLTKPTRKTP